MLDKLKQIKQLREMQGILAKEEVDCEKRGVKVVMNGKMEILEIKFNPEFSMEEQEKAVIDCVNETIKKLQRTLALKMQGMGGLGM